MLILLFTPFKYDFLDIIEPYFPKQSKYKVGLVLYNNFTILDLAGPSEIFDDFPEYFETVTIGKEANSYVKSNHNTLRLQVKLSIREAKKQNFDILMIPGAFETGLVVMDDPKFMKDYAQLAEKSKVVFTVCTGSIILAKTGLLNNTKATTNKMAYSYFTPHYPKVEWVRKARYVHHKKFITSSGVTAGTDAAIYILSLIVGEKKALEYAKSIEFVATLNPDEDPFATLSM